MEKQLIAMLRALIVPGRPNVAIGIFLLALLGCTGSPKPESPTDMQGVSKPEGPVDLERLSEGSWDQFRDGSSPSPFVVARGFLLADHAILPTTKGGISRFQVSSGAKIDSVALGFRISEFLRVGDVTGASNEIHEEPIRVSGIRLPSFKVIWSKTLNGLGGASLARLDDQAFLAASAAGYIFT